MTDSDVYSVVYNSDAHLAEHVSGDMSAHRSTIFLLRPLTIPLPLTRFSARSHALPFSAAECRLQLDPESVT